jgi:hypothetical protein
MPSKERFQTRPIWACLQTLSFKSNFAFRSGQQPKPQIWCFGFLVGVLTDIAIEPPKPGGFKRGFLASLAEKMPLFGGAFYGHGKPCLYGV